MKLSALGANIEALINISLGFWGQLYYNCRKESPKPSSNNLGPYITGFYGCQMSTALHPSPQ